MQLDERNPHREHSVPQRDARVRERRRIEEDQRRLVVTSSMNATDQLGFRVALKRDELVPERLGAVFERIFDRSEGGGAVNTRLASAEQPEIRPIQQEQS